MRHSPKPPSWATLAAGLFLVGCQEPLKPDPAALGSLSQEPKPAPDCASCHAYPLHDVNHAYHLHSMNAREGVQAKFVFERKNGAVLCMDCHFGSVAHRNYNWYDTLWGTEGDLRTSADKLPGDPIFRIDSIPGFLPLPVGLPAGAATSAKVDSLIDHEEKLGGVVAWLTAKRHFNDTVDIEFSANIVLDTSLSRKAYHPADLSCSSIECHNAPRKTYRWASKDKGLTGCPTLEHTPELDSSCGYSPTQEPK